MSSTVVQPMLLTEVLTPVKKQRKTKLPSAPRMRKSPSTPPSSRVESSRQLFSGDILHVKLARPKVPDAPKKPKKTISKTKKSKPAALPKRLYVLLDPSGKPVSVHINELSANKRYWAETSLHGGRYSINETESDNS